MINPHCRGRKGNLGTDHQKAFFSSIKMWKSLDSEVDSALS